MDLTTDQRRMQTAAATAVSEQSNISKFEYSKPIYETSTSFFAVIRLVSFSIL